LPPPLGADADGGTDEGSDLVTAAEGLRRLVKAEVYQPLRDENPVREKFLGLTDELQGLVVKRRGEPMPSRRTFAADILSFTHSLETSLRHPGCAQSPTPLDWHGLAPHPNHSARSLFRERRMWMPKPGEGGVDAVFVSFVPSWCISYGCVIHG
jgi:hypothetical protein